MSYDISVKENGGDFELLAEGLYPAVCFAIADIGQQESTYNNISNVVSKIVLGFETEGGDRIWAEYTKSLNAKSKLRPVLESWRGAKFSKEELEDFKMSNILGKSCQIQVMHNQAGTWANIASIVSKSKEVEPTDKPFIFTVEDPKLEHYDELPKYIQKKVDNRVGAIVTKVEEAPAETVSRAPIQALEF